jgi:hypothetical protein
MAILFDYHINYSSDCDNLSSLPFSVFGMSQEGFSHISASIGNQDAGCVYIGRNIIIGSIADGCTSGNNLNGKSFNQVGAHLTSYLICRLIRKLVLKNHFPLKNIKEPLERDLLNHFKRISNTLNPWQFERAVVINNFLASTFLTFVLTKDEYLILGCGDGAVYLNAKPISQVREGGAYFSNNLIQSKVTVNEISNDGLRVPINIIAHGRAEDLASILISTDGFIDNDVEEINQFNTFFFENMDTKLKNGFNDLKLQFRNDVVDKIIAAKDGRIWPYDDATFISLKRNS